MRLSDDIRSPILLHLKGWLFLLIAVMAAAILIAENPQWKTAALCLLLGWAAARFYYYLFYVLEKYAGRNRRYAGVLDELKVLLSRKKD